MVAQRAGSDQNVRFSAYLFAGCKASGFCALAHVGILTRTNKIPAVETQRNLRMFNPSARIIDSFVGHIRQRFEESFSSAPESHTRLLDQSARAAMEAVLDCDCPHHDIQHTMLVTDIGQTILHGRQLVFGDVSQNDWLHAVIAMMFHDIGYIRGLLKEDDDTSFLIDDEGNRISPPPRCTDAFMTPWHVTRGCLFVRDRFRNEPLIHLDTLTEYIEMTRFPVPRRQAYQRLDDIAALVRSADLLGQMADPLYLKKLSRLFAEFLETGEAARQGFTTAGELRANFSRFFNSQVRPYVGNGLKYLRRSQDGQQWIANLIHHLHADDSDNDTLFGAHHLDNEPIPIRA